MLLIWTHSSITTSASKVFGKPFLGNPNYILSLSAPCLAVEKNNAFSIYDLYYHAIAQHKPKGAHEINNLGTFPWSSLTYN